MKLAIVHDYLNQYGGAERIIEIFHEMFPDAPIYTSIFDADRLPPVFRTMDIRPSFMQRLPLVKRFLPYYLPFFPLAFEQFDLRSYDVILSSTTAWGKGVITTPDCLHICYCNTPMRFAWRYHDYLQDRDLSPLTRSVLAFLLHPIRLWDVVSSNYVDYFIANSDNVSRRIAKIYRRESHVIPCPVDCSKYQIETTIDDYYLVVSRLRPYKRIDLVIQAFNQLNRPLVIIGDGDDRPRLERLASPQITFLGKVSDETLQSYYRRCRALIFPGEEDFGLTPLEAQASGRPVIAYARGGALETVVDGVTGRLFYPQTPEALADAVRAFDVTAIDSTVLRAQAMRFDVTHFKQKIRSFLDQCLSERHPCSASASASSAG